MSSSFGNRLKVSVFGQSHGEAIGVTVDGLPAGEPIDMEALHRFLARRQPGKSALSTARREPDVPVFLSGVLDGVTCGSPLTAIIENRDARSGDYAGFTDTPRPGHADYTAFVKWQGKADMRGGGHFSGRLTAPLCIAGGIALQLLARRGVYVGAHLLQIGHVTEEPFPLRPDKALFDRIAGKDFPVVDDARGALMQAEILAAAKAQDSVGGAVQCAVIGLPAGLGGPMFDGMESRLSAALFGIPSVKGVSFGSGFDCITMRGSMHNDTFCFDRAGSVATETNRCGGILGGITDGMPLTFQLAVKPTPSIGIPQKTVNLRTMEEKELTIAGRHDPCIAPRAVPVVEAVTALVLLDIILEENAVWN